MDIYGAKLKDRYVIYKVNVICAIFKWILHQILLNNLITFKCIDKTITPLLANTAKPQMHCTHTKPILH